MDTELSILALMTMGVGIGLSCAQKVAQFATRKAIQKISTQLTNNPANGTLDHQYAIANVILLGKGLDNSLGYLKRMSVKITLFIVIGTITKNELYGIFLKDCLKEAKPIRLHLVTRFTD
jgi:hypothetical protein